MSCRLETKKKIGTYNYIYDQKGWKKIILNFYDYF